MVSDVFLLGLLPDEGWLLIGDALASGDSGGEDKEGVAGVEGQGVEGEGEDGSEGGSAGDWSLGVDDSTLGPRRVTSSAEGLGFAGMGMSSDVVPAAGLL